MNLHTVTVVPPEKGKLGMTITFDLDLIGGPVDPFLFREFLELLIDLRNEP